MGAEAMSKSTDRFNVIATELAELFAKKNHDYADSWREMRPTTILDLIRAKTRRIDNLLTLRSSGENGKVNESIEDSLRDIANYAIIAMIQEKEATDDAERLA
jgi:hypothetical protein